ncbi:bifunctional phosphoribosylaminoimidazolecarboxamide formyltransferase/IMP cyclohydrolase [Corynebacterium kroppenstedtii]|uniref:bifunctional phosphoribosylaminoimidazolecarboxamide formyltransferase/IMP cyclohydrolase n=1 Tax=Corynebacterium sp. PCR 32 TaxID=3351342 RepID=UPI0030B25D79
MTDMSSAHPAPASPTSRIPITRALISVYDKTGVTDLAASLHANGVEIVSTGSTAAHITDAGIPVTLAENLTGFPECLDGRVKTLHPKIHAGILADTRNPVHVKQLQDMGIDGFQLVIVNLYPFSETVASGAERDACVEKIDIGGPSMVRAAAKNHQSVAVVVNPDDYDRATHAAHAGGFTLQQRIDLASRAFQHTASYDVAVATWMAEQSAAIQAATSCDDATNPGPSDGTGNQKTTFGEFVGATYTLSRPLRYGENPHQAAALYIDSDGHPGLAHAEQLHGKEMSYNNYTDGDAAWRAVWDHPDEICVSVIKHANPCGIAISRESVADAHRKAHACDPVSAYGGIIAANQPVTVEMAEAVKEIFTEAIIAPSFDDDALEVLKTKKNLRVLVAPKPERDGCEYTEISGGVLVQQRDILDAPGDDPASWELVAGEPADSDTLTDLVFAWRSVRAVKSNAIVLAKDGATVGVGMGQVNRVDSARLSVQRAGVDRARGAVAASDAFFPFADGFGVLAEAGVRAVVQPGGSIRDEEVIDAARQAGVTMYLTKERHFFH